MLGTKITSGTKIVDVEILGVIQIEAIKIQVTTLDPPILGKMVVKEVKVKDPLITKMHRTRIAP